MSSETPAVIVKAPTMTPDVPTEKTAITTETAPTGLLPPPPLKEDETIERAIGWIASADRREATGPAFLKDKYFGHSLNNTVAVFVACFFTYVLAWLGFSLAWCFPIWAVFAAYYDISITRFRRNVRDDIERYLAKKGLESDTESVHWLNNFLERFWLIYEPVLSASITASVNPILESSTPSFLDHISLTEFTLGSKGPRIEEIRTYPRTEQDVVMMDWKLSFVPGDNLDLTQRQIQNRVNPKIVLTIRVGKGIVSTGIPILVEDISFQGHMRIKIKLMNNYPHLKMLEFSFLEPPSIDYELKPIGGDALGFDIAHIPGLQGYIRDTMHSILGPMMYNPNVYPLDIEAMMTGPGYGEAPKAIGVLKLSIRSAKGIKAADLLGKSDAYVKVHIENRVELAKTRFIENTLTPVWDETFNILIYDLTEKLTLDMYDYNALKADKFLGSTTFDLSSLTTNPDQEDVNLKIIREKGKEGGELNLGAHWLPIAEPIKNEDGTETPIQSNMGILRVSIHQVKELDARKSIIGQFNPYALLKYNGTEVKKTKVLKRTLNPVWEDVTEIFCSNLQAAKLTVEIKDDRDLANDMFLGDWDQTGASAVEKTTGGVDWFPLNHAKMGKLKISTVWRPLGSADGAGGALDGGSKPDPIGVVRIAIKEAKQLFNTELTGKADPYARVRTGNIVAAKTRVIESELNPNWDEVVYVPVHRAAQVLFLDVMDWNNVKKDATIGSTELKLENLLIKNEDGSFSGKPAVQQTATLAHDKEKNRGFLTFSASFHPTNPIKKKEEPKPVVEAPPVEGEAPAEVPVAEPVVVEKVDLTKFKSGILAMTIHSATGFPKPLALLAEVQVNYNEYSPAYRSSVTKKTNAPEWNEMAQCFIKETEFETVSIIIKEKGDDSDDVWSRTNFQAYDLLRDFTETTDPKEYTIELAEEQYGNVKISCRFIPVNIEIDPTESMLNQGSLNLTIVKAKNLVALDSSGTSDPYIQVTLDGEKLFKSKIIKKDLNPTFNESTQLSIPSRTKASLLLQVYDWNKIQEDECIGTAVVDLTDLEPRLSIEKSVPLAEHPNSFIVIRLNFTPGFVTFHMKRTSTLAAVGTMINPLTGAKSVMNIGKGIGKGAVGGVSGAFGGVKSVFGGKKKEEAPKPSLAPPATAPPATALPAVITEESSPPESTRDTLTLPSKESAPSSPILSTHDNSSTSRLSVSSTSANHYGKLTLTIVEAKELKAVDSGGTSDPYVKVLHNKKEVLKTQVVKKNLNPTWNEQVSVPNVNIDGLSLTFEVKDYNRIGANVTIGEINLDVSKYLNLDNGVFSADFWTDTLTGGGQLHLKLDYHQGMTEESKRQTIFGKAFK